MSGRFPLGPFDSGLRQPFLIECDLEGARVTAASFNSGFGRRGVEHAFEGAGLVEATRLAARICAPSSIAHSLAFCCAVEDAEGVDVEDGPAALRAVLAEYERIAAHLGVLSDVGRSLEDDIVCRGPGRYISRVCRAFTAASGSPFAFGMIVPGGVRVEGSLEAIDGLSDMRRALARDSSFWEVKLKASRARLLGARLPGGAVPGEAPSAPAFRASGTDVDLRSGESAYGCYSKVDCEPVVRQDGTALDRLLLLTAEIRASLGIIEEVGGGVEPVPGEPEEFPSEGGNGVGVCESPTGAVEHRVSLGPGGTVIHNRIVTQVEAVAGTVGDALSGIMYEDLVPSVLSFHLCAACINL
ncbi:MAG: hypothetical protein L6427_13135 [Actinomycetia bacterium]|nr:hypothetical protein [Actinomycetes bacterium]